MLEKRSSSHLTSDKATEKSKPLGEAYLVAKSYPLTETLDTLMIIDPPSPYGRNLKKN